jgi:hypothetical protein
VRPIIFCLDRGFKYVRKLLPHLPTSLKMSSQLDKSLDEITAERRQVDPALESLSNVVELPKQITSRSRSRLKTRNPSFSRRSTKGTLQPICPYPHTCRPPQHTAFFPGAIVVERVRHTHIHTCPFFSMRK